MRIDEAGAKNFIGLTYRRFCGLLRVTGLGVIRGVVLQVAGKFSGGWRYTIIWQHQRIEFQSGLPFDAAIETDGCGVETGKSFAAILPA